MITIFTSFSSSGSTQAKKWLESQNISFKERNMSQYPMKEKELYKILKFSPEGFDTIISKQSKSYAQIYDKIDDMKFSELFHLILRDHTLLKKPILIDDIGNLVVGYKEDDFEIFKKR